MIPRVVVILSLFIGLFGVGSYWKSGPSTARSTVQAKTLTDRANPAANMTAPPNVKSQKESAALADKTESQSQKPLHAPAPVSPMPPAIAVSEPVYLCGAQTKKGTPCSRRVKGSNRCFQHLGMPVMQTADKLKIN